MIRTLTLLAGLAALPASATTLHGTTVGKYSKPGAAVDFAHTVKPNGSGVSVTLEVLEDADSGTVEVELHVPDALRVSGPTSARFDAAQGGRHSLVFTAASDVEGLHHVGVTARMEGEFRSYAVPVQIGFGSLVRKSGTAAVLRGGMAVMPATETVNGTVVQTPEAVRTLSD